jgi:hypothetical protein
MNQPRILAAALLLGSAFLATRVQAQYTWEGTTSSDPTVATNWNGTPPTIGGTNGPGLNVVNGANNALIFNQGAGSITTFGDQWLVGDTSAPGGSMMVTSGTVTFNTGNAAIIAQNNGQTSTVTINGGTLNYDSGIYLGNNGGTSATLGILDISSGAFNVNAAFTADTIGSGGMGPNDGSNFVLGRQGATGEVNLSGTGTMTLTSTGTTDASFTFAGGSSDFINFATNYTGSISLSDDGVNGSTEAAFDSSIAAGNIQIGGTTTGVTDNSFTVNSVGGYDVYTLTTAAPEPTSVVLLIGGLGILVFIQRRFRSIV